jgi:hypothetical protein
MTLDSTIESGLGADGWLRGKTKGTRIFRTSRKSDEKDVDRSTVEKERVQKTEHATRQRNGKLF